MELLATTDLPGLFAGLEPPPAAPVDLPADAQVAGLAESAIASTTRITSAGCGALLSVGSGFFVGPQHAVTNAHVVAGSTTTTVRLNGADLDASVVVFDPAPTSPSSSCREPVHPRSRCRRPCPNVGRRLPSSAFRVAAT